MKTSFKIYTVLCAAVACAISLTACGSDSGSNANDDSSITSSSSNKASNNEGRQKITYDTLALSIDTEAKLLNVSNEGAEENLCVAVDNGFKWKTVKKRTYSSKIKYTFIGDTLVLYEWWSESERYDQYGTMLVGGKGGDIYGTWTIIPCLFDSEEKETSCDEDEEEEGLMQSSFTISEDKFARKLAGIYLNKSLNYPTSNFRRLFNHYLSKGPGGDLPTANELFHESVYDDENSTFDGVTIKELSASGETFISGGKTIIVNVLNFEDNFQNWKASVTVSVDGETCQNDYENYYDMTESLCDAKYSENYSLGTKTDKDGNEFKYVSQFRKNNHEEFLECLEPLTDPIIESIGKDKSY
jgi:hypothetical protein